MNKLFVLSGSSNSGKTTTLNTLADTLYKMQGSKLGTAINIPHIDATDDKYYFDLQINRRNVRVGIFTSGDYPSAIVNAFNFFTSNNCEVCFAASKLYGNTVNAIESLALANGIIPQYQYMVWQYPYNLRTQNAIQLGIVNQLISMI